MSGLSDGERRLLREAVRESLSGTDPLGQARDALDGGSRHDDWPVAVAAGWPGMLAGETAGGAGLGPPEALLVVRELGRMLSGIPLPGHLLATALTGAASGAPAVAGSAPAGGAPSPPGGLATGERRAAWLPARPEAGGAISVDPVAGAVRPAGPRVDDEGRVTGTFGWVPDAPGADVLISSAMGPDGRPWIALVAAGAAEVEEVASYDGSRRLGHVRLEGAPAALVAAPAGAAEDQWALAQALLGADSLGAAEHLLELSVEHARARFAFGRAIGSFQAVKHQIVEMLRRIENGRALADHAAGALATGAADRHTAACALRYSAGDALDFAARTAIAVHGGMGATWEHPVGLYFRRGQVTRRLLAGQAAAAAEVGRRLLTVA